MHWFGGRVISPILGQISKAYNWAFTVPLYNSARGSFRKPKEGIEFELKRIANNYSQI